MPCTRWRESMNKVILMGRLTKDPDIRYSNDNKAVAKYTLAVDGYKDETDFLNCVAFGKSAEFAEKYLHKGIKILVVGRIQTGSYEKEGRKFYTTDIVVESQAFCESKSESATWTKGESKPEASGDGFFNMPKEMADELPFNQEE